MHADYYFERSAQLLSPAFCGISPMLSQLLQPRQWKFPPELRRPLSRTCRYLNTLPCCCCAVDRAKPQLVVLCRSPSPSATADDDGCTVYCLRSYTLRVRDIRSKNKVIQKLIHSLFMVIRSTLGRSVPTVLQKLVTW